MGMRPLFSSLASELRWISSLVMLLFFVSCNSQLADLTPIRRTPVSLTTTNEGTFTKMMIYATNVDGSFAFARQFTSSALIEQEVPIGQYNFYGMTFNGLTSERCSKVSASLKGLSNQVILNFDEATCADPDFLGNDPTLNLATLPAVTLPFTRIELCDSVSNITSGSDACTDDLDDATRVHGRGHAVSYRITLLQFEKTNGEAVVSSGMFLGCETSNYPVNSVRGLINSSILNYLPAGDGSSTPFKIRFEFYSQGSCAGTSYVVDLDHGLKTSSSKAKYVITPGAPAQQKLYFKLAEEEICHGDALTAEFVGGPGSISSPRLICNEAQLYNIFPNTAVAADYTLSAAKSYKLLADIDLSDNPVTGSGFSPAWESCVVPGSNFMPIGRTYDGTTCGSGHIPDANFDGNGHSIKGLRIRNPLALTAGFYGTLPSGGRHQIQRLTFIDSVVYGRGSTGTVAGLAKNAHFRDIVLVNPLVHAPLYDRIGGLVGETEAGSIQNVSISNLNLTGRDYVGGLVGNSIFSITSPSITKAYVNGIINGRGTVGGIVGIHNSATAGTLATISNSRFSGSINTSDRYAGGLVGWAYTTRIENSYAQAAFNSTFNGSAYLGGIVGYFVDNTVSGSGGVYSSYASWSVSDICANGALCFIGEVVGATDPSYNVQHFDTTVWAAESALGLTTHVVGSSQPSTTFIDASPGWIKADTSSLMGFFLPSVWVFSDFANPKLVDEP